MNATAKIAHFSVDGEGLTDVARNIMLSETPGKAWKLLAQNLIGDRADEVARRLLDGKMKLVGIDNLEAVEDDDAAGYIKDLKYIYAGRVRIDRAWWRPVAEVVRFGRDDAKFAMVGYDMAETEEILDTFAAGTDIVAAGAVGRMRDLWRRRVAFYADRSERVFELTIEGRRRWVVFQPCGEPPFWWDENATVEAAFLQCVDAGRRLDERGADVDATSDISEGLGAAFIEAFATVDDVRRDTISERLERDRQKQYAEEDKRWRRTLSVIRAQVLHQANGDTMDLFHRGKLVATVPRAPFVCWAMSRTRQRHLAPEWEPRSPSGLKLAGDDRFHSDWFFASAIYNPEESEVEIDPETGGPLRYPYNHESPLERAASDAMFELQTTLGRFTVAVIVDGDPVTGVVGKDIIVLPNLSPDHLPRLVNARGVVTEAGGKAAHLAQVALERSLPMMLMPDARTKLRDGDTITMTPAEGRIRVHSTMSDLAEYQ